MGILALEVTFKKANRKADDSVTVSFETQGEVTTEQMAEIDSYRKMSGHLVFSRDHIKGSDIPKGDTAQTGKTPSQELRSSLYALWASKHERGIITEDWETYYYNAIMGFKRAVDSQHPSND